MAVEPIWVSREDAEASQLEVVRLSGGSAGVLHSGLLDSALARARNQWAYEGADLGECAAAYAYGIAMNHGFKDGNKRTALAVAIMFLAYNRLRLTASPEEAAATMIALARHELDEDGLAEWFSANTARL